MTPFAAGVAVDLLLCTTRDHIWPRLGAISDRYRSARLCQGHGLRRSERTELLNECAGSLADLLGPFGRVVFRRKADGTSLLRLIDKLPKPSHFIDYVYLIEEVVAITGTKPRNLASTFNWVDLPRQYLVSEI